MCCEPGPGLLREPGLFRYDETGQGCGSGSAEQCGPQPGRYCQEWADAVGDRVHPDLHQLAAATAAGAFCSPYPGGADPVCRPDVSMATEADAGGTAGRLSQQPDNRGCPGQGD